MQARLFSSGYAGLPSKIAQKPHNQRKQDAQDNRSRQGKIKLGVAAAASPLNVSGKASKGKTETPGNKYHDTQGHQDEPQTYNGFSQLCHGVIVTREETVAHLRSAPLPPLSKFSTKWNLRERYHVDIFLHPSSGLSKKLVRGAPNFIEAAEK